MTSNQGDKMDQVNDEQEVTIETVRMKKSISLFHAIVILLTVTGHISIFISPSQLFQLSQSVGASLIIWLIGGIFNLGVCLCFVELSMIFPKAGGPYSYLLGVFGPLPAFLIQWGYMMMICGPFWAFVAYSASLYILQTILGCKPLELGVRVLAAWILLSLVALNCVYMKYITKVQTILSTSKIIGLLIIILLGCYRVYQGEIDNIEEPFANNTDSVGDMSLAIFFSIFYYGGWQVFAGLIEEVKRPEKDIPKAIYLSFLVNILLYVLANLSYFIVLSPHQITTSSAIAVVFINNFSPALTPLMTFLVGVCCVGVLNASIMGHSRNLFAAARNGHMPALIGTLHMTFLTPWAAIITISLWSFLMIATGSINVFVAFIQLFSSTMNVFVIFTLLYLRWSEPERKRPYKLNIVAAGSIFVLNILILITCIITNPRRLAVGICLFLSGFPVYAFGVKWKNKPVVFTRFIEKVTKAAQKALLLVKST